MSRIILATVLLALFAIGPSRSFADVVFCQRRKHVTLRVDACKKKEQVVGGPMGPQGPMGQAGEPGQAGPAGPSGTPDSGCPGPRIAGVCLLGYNNNQTTGFIAAALQCAALGGDLCTDSQSWPFSVGFWQNLHLAPSVLYGPHWTASFADNDAGQWNGVNGGTGDDHSANSSYGYACCGGTTPPNPRVAVTTVNNVKVVTIHNVADTPFSGAVAYCAALNADLCSDSQTLLLRDAGALTVAAWTNSHSDNDASGYNEITGGTTDNPDPSQLYGFACCPSLRPSDLSCPVPTTLGVCATVIHNSADANFGAAAQACATAGADLCSDAQAGILHSASALTVATWTNSHSDNDSGSLDTILGLPPANDNPNLATPFGYGCCLK